MDKSVFYKKISNVELYDEVGKSQEQNHPTQRFQIIVYSIAHKILRQRRFFHTTDDWKEDACSYALIKCCDVYHKYDLSRNSSAYAFFHQTIKNSIYDCFTKDFYKYFEMKKNLIQYNSSSDQYNDLYYDDIKKDEDKKYKDQFAPKTF